MGKLILLTVLTGLWASCSKSPPASVESKEIPQIVVAPTQPQVAPPPQPLAPPPPRPLRISRTWTFGEDVKVRILSGGAMSFREGGKVDADFLRLHGDAVILKLIDGNNAEIPIASLSEADQACLESVAGVVIDERPLNREANWRKADLAAESRAILAEKAREEARIAAQNRAEEAAKAQKEWWEKFNKSLEPEPYYPPAVRGRWPARRVPPR